MENKTPNFIFTMEVTVLCVSESPKVSSAWVLPTPPQWPLTSTGFGLVLARGEGERAPNLALDGGVLL